MKKLISAILFLILTSPLCFGLEDFHFSVSPRMGLTFGELNELLYYSDGTLVSQLDWEQKPLFDIGLSSAVSFNNFIFSAAFDYSIPVGTSYMYDSDWEDGKRYSFTEHPIKKSVNLSSELSAGYKINIVQKISVIPQLSFDYLYNNFEADIGTGKRYEKEVKVYGVDYKRHSFFIFTGLCLDVSFNKIFSLDVDFEVAPWGYQYSFDYHHGLKRPFSTEEYQYSIFTKYKAGVCADFMINDLLSIQCFTRVLFGFPDKGVLYSDYDTTTLTESKNQKGGANIKYLKTGFGVSFGF